MERAKVDVVERDGGLLVFLDATDSPSWGNFGASVAAREFRLTAVVAARKLLGGSRHSPLHDGGGDVSGLVGFDGDFAWVSHWGIFASQEEAVVDWDACLIEGDFMRNPDDG